MIEWLWGIFQDLRVYLVSNYDPWRDTIDILLVALGIYWLLLLIRGTRAVQVLFGLFVLLGALLASNVFELVTLRLILDVLLAPGAIILVILFQNDIRRALARMGRGFFPTGEGAGESQAVEEVVRAARALSERRVGALLVIERETRLEDQVEAGSQLDAELSKDLLVSIFLPESPLHDGAVVIQQGRLMWAGCILPLTLKTDLPEGVGTRHRAAVGITEETDAVVVVVSEETAAMSVVMGGEIAQNLAAPELREVLTEILSSDRRELPASALEAARPPAAPPARGLRKHETGAGPAARSAG